MVLNAQNQNSESILSYIKLIRTDIDSLMHMYFKSGIENLKYALNASDENRLEYLRQARNRFIDATTIEKNENLIMAYLGLSVCQLLMGDIKNSEVSLTNISTLEYDNSYIYDPDNKWFSEPKADLYLKYVMHIIYNSNLERMNEEYPLSNGKPRFNSFDINKFYEEYYYRFCRREEYKYEEIKPLIESKFNRFHELFISKHPIISREDIKKRFGYNIYDDLTEKQEMECKKIIEESLVNSYEYAFSTLAKEDFEDLKYHIRVSFSK